MTRTKPGNLRSWSHYLGLTRAAQSLSWQCPLSYHWQLRRRSDNRTLPDIQIARCAQPSHLHSWGWRYNIRREHLPRHSSRIWLKLRRWRYNPTVQIR